MYQHGKLNTAQIFSSKRRAIVTHITYSLTLTMSSYQAADDYNNSAFAILPRQGAMSNVLPSDANMSTAPWGNVTSRPLPIMHLLTKPPHMVALYTVAYLIVFILAVVNNSLVVSVIIRNPAMRNVTNYFLGNLALADILVSLIVLPFTLGSQIFVGK